MAAGSLLPKPVGVHCTQLKGTGCPSWTRTSSTGHWVLPDFLTLPLAHRARPSSRQPLGMWEGLVSLLSPFNFDLSGAVSAGWVGGFSDVYICLLEWAQVNNLIWRGHQEIHVQVLRIYDFIKTIKDLILKTYFASLQIIAPVLPLVSTCSSKASWRENLLNCPTHSEVAPGSHRQPTPPAALPGTELEADDLAYSSHAVWH